MENEHESTAALQKENKPRCTNCGKKMPVKSAFCPHCGQKRQKRRVTMRDVLQKLWDTTFHLENKFFRMFRQVLVPGKVTVEYFKGRVQRYPHPIKFFMVCMFFFVLVVSAGQQITVSASGTAGAPSSNLFGIFNQTNIAAVKGKIELYDELIRQWDSLPAGRQTLEDRRLLDSMLLNSGRSFAYLRTDSFDFVTNAILFKKPYRIAYRDLLFLKTDSIYQLYHVADTWDRLLLRKSIKASNDPKAVGRFWLGSLTWTLLLLVAVMAGWLFLFYRRQGKFYVEHFVWQLHLQSGMVLVFTLAILAGRLFHWSMVFSVLFLFWCWVASLLAMRRFYEQPWGPTLIKWFCYWLLCGLSITLLFLSSIFVSVLIF